MGQWQIMRLLGKYRDPQGPRLALKSFHDTLLQNGSLPLTVVESLILNDSSDLDQVLASQI